MTNELTTWEPPRGLDHSRPREVRLTAGGIALLIGIAVLLAGAVMCFVILSSVAVQQGEEQRLLREEGAEAQAVVTRVWRTSGEKKQAWVSYTFAPDKTGVVFEGRSKIPTTLWQTLVAGSTIPVRFASTHPEFNRPVVVRDRPTPPWLAYLTAAILVLIAGLLTQPLRGQRHLLVEGRAAPGRVTSLKKGDKGTVVHFEYPVLSGATRSGQSGPMTKPPSVGSSVVVIYDPDQPRHHGLYPMGLVRLLLSEGDSRIPRAGASRPVNRHSASRQRAHPGSGE